MKKPNFIMVGAPKAGTTSIAQYLKEHPEIFISEEKEPFYFLPDILEKMPKEDIMYTAIEKKGHFTPESYYGLFDGVTSERAVGEATVHYLFHYDEVIPRILSELGDIKIIIVLRNPAHRAFSNYKFQINNQLYTFEEALKVEEQRKLKGYNSFWFYKEQGKYYEPVKAYLDNFTNVHVAFFEDLKENPIQFMKNMYGFLGVNTEFTPSIGVAHNKTLVPRNKLFRILFYLKRNYRFHLYLPKSIKQKIIAKGKIENTEKIKPETLRYLQKYFKPDILQLEKLLKKGLSNWYS